MEANIVVGEAPPYHGTMGGAIDTEHGTMYIYIYPINYPIKMYITMYMYIYIPLTIPYIYMYNITTVINFPLTIPFRYYYSTMTVDPRCLTFPAFPGASSSQASLASLLRRAWHMQRWACCPRSCLVWGWPFFCIHRDSRKDNYRKSASNIYKNT